MNLSDHFTLREAEKSQYAERHKDVDGNPAPIDNTAPDHIIPKLAYVAEHILEPVRVHFGTPFTPNSFYRGPELNAAIGGSRNSQHMKGEAVDFEIPGISNIETARWIASNLDRFDQLVLECFTGPPDSGWVHCSITEHGVNRRQILTFNGKTYSEGLPSIS